MVECEVTQSGDGKTWVRFRGAFTERVHLEDIVVAAGDIVIDGAAIRRINSVGVKRFLQFLDRIGGGGPIEAVRCSPAMVAQLNLILPLARKLTVRSVIAPMECKECVAEADILIPIEGAGIPVVPKRGCEVCGGDMVLAELESRYFAFTLP